MSLYLLHLTGLLYSHTSHIVIRLWWLSIQNLLLSLCKCLPPTIIVIPSCYSLIALRKVSFLYDIPFSCLSSSLYVTLKIKHVIMFVTFRLHNLTLDTHSALHWAHNKTYNQYLYILTIHFLPHLEYSLPSTYLYTMSRLTSKFHWFLI